MGETEVEGEVAEEEEAAVAAGDGLPFAFCGENER